MPQVVISAHALADMEKLKKFLEGKDRDAAKRAAQAILAAINSLAQYPDRGKDASWIGSNAREVLIDFGNTSYISHTR